VREPALENAEELSPWRLALPTRATKSKTENKMPCGIITGAQTKVTHSGGILNRKALLNNKTGGRPTQICRSENQAPNSNDEEKNLV
jgi:hypothetical protein